MAVKSLKRAQNKIKIKDLKLDALLEVTLAINSNVTKEELFGIYEKVLRELDIEKIALYIYESEWNLATWYGLEGEKLNINVGTQDLLIYEEIEEVNSKSEAIFDGFDLIIPFFTKLNLLPIFLLC